MYTADVQDKLCVLLKDLCTTSNSPYEKYGFGKILVKSVGNNVRRTFIEMVLTDNVGSYEPFRENALNVKINIDSDRKNYILSIGNYVNDEINLDNSNEDDSEKDAFTIQSITLYYDGKSTGIICGYVFGRQNEVWLDYSVLDDAVKKGWFDKSARNVGIVKVINEFRMNPDRFNKGTPSIIIDAQNSTLVYDTEYYATPTIGHVTIYYLGLIMQDGSYQIFSSIGDPAEFTGISGSNYVIDCPQLSDDKTGYTFSIKFDWNSKHITSEIFIDGKDGKITEISRKSVNFTINDAINEILTSKDCYRHYVYDAYYQYEFPAGDNLIYELVTLFQGMEHVEVGNTVEPIPFYIESYYLYIIRKDGSYTELTSKITEAREIKQYEQYEVDNMTINFKIANIEVSNNNKTLTFDLYDSQHKETPIKCSVDINTEKITLSE